MVLACDGDGMEGSEGVANQLGVALSMGGSRGGVTPRQHDVTGKVIIALDPPDKIVVIPLDLLVIVLSPEPSR